MLLRICAGYEPATHDRFDRFAGSPEQESWIELSKRGPVSVVVASESLEFSATTIGGRVGRQHPIQMLGTTNVGARRRAIEVRANVHGGFARKPHKSLSFLRCMTVRREPLPSAATTIGGSEAALVPANRAFQHVQQLLRVDRADDDARVAGARFGREGVTELDHELEGRVADLEVVRVECANDPTGFVSWLRAPHTRSTAGIFDASTASGGQRADNVHADSELTSMTRIPNEIVGEGSATVC